MPTVSRFNGIVIAMYYDDHPPPHFHAIYQGARMQVAIDPVAILNGSLPAAQTRLVLAWAQKRQNELMVGWHRLRANLPPSWIAP